MCVSFSLCIFLVLLVVLKVFTYHPWKASFKLVERPWPDSTVNTKSQVVIVGSKKKKLVYQQ